MRRENGSQIMTLVLTLALSSLIVSHAHAGKCHKDKEKPAEVENSRPLPDLGEIEKPRNPDGIIINPESANRRSAVGNNGFVNFRQQLREAYATFKANNPGLSRKQLKREYKKIRRDLVLNRANSQVGNNTLVDTANNSGSGLVISSVDYDAYLSNNGGLSGRTDNSKDQDLFTSGNTGSGSGSSGFSIQTTTDAHGTR